MNNLIHIENRAGKLKLNERVNKESADKLIEELETLYGNSAVAAQMKIGDIVCSADDALEYVEVEINSPGGSVLEGQRIYNSLRDASNRGVKVTTTVNGMAASMGSVILMAGDDRKMTHGSRIMIHEASTIVMGDAKDMQRNADLLEGISSELAGIYAERTGGDATDIRNLMHAETWMDTTEAKARGFINSVIKDGKDQSDSELVDIRDESPKNSSMSILSKLFPDKEEDLQAEAAFSEIESLRADLVEVTKSNESLTDQIKTKDQTIAENTAAIEDLNKAAAEASEKITGLEASLEEAKAEVTETRESVGKQVAEALGSIGQNAPVETIVDNGTEGSGEMSREDFNAMSPRERTEFSKNGGKIKTD